MGTNNVWATCTMPTGVAMHEARRQLFDAAARVLLRDGPGALTSRAVTTEAGCAKGVLHRHFTDFEAFLAELVVERIDRLGDQATALFRSAGTGTIADNLTNALVAVFESVAGAIVGLVMSRHDVRIRLRQTTPTGVPMLTEAKVMIASYLTAEKDLGRIAVDADVDTLALALIGSAHLVFAGQSSPPETRALRNIVAAVLPAVAHLRDCAVEGRW